MGTVAAAEKVNLREKLGRIHELWSPKILAQVNDAYLKLVKVKGEYVWHDHKREDELFLVVRGRITVQFRDHDVELVEGEFVVVPKGVEHRPVAEQEADVLLIEPTTTVNTGNVREARTQTELEWI
ncbi:MAG TPA: cupin domain-containing protein [Thermoplasmata archaeon]|nr:cupin domain-containing protein [Thermoplasmata archaeon]